MARPISVRLGALVLLAVGCSSQSIEAVGVVACLKTPDAAGCAGQGGVPAASGGIAGATGGAATTGGVAASGGAVGSGGGAGEDGSGSLIHRYSLDGTGTTAVDSVGKANGLLVNTTLDGAGAVTVADDGVKNQSADEFVDLPNQLISRLPSVTLEAWVTWAGGAPWQRIFDFGDDTGGVEGARTGNGKTYLFFTPRSGTDEGGLLRVAFAADGLHEVRLDATRTLPTNVKTHVAVVIDSDTEQWLVYLNGALEKAAAFPANRLAMIHDVNNWLGRSNYDYDPGFTGTFHEFRVYSAALDAQQIRASFSAGSEEPVPGL